MAFVHPALFYENDAEYLSGTVPFIRGGLEAGEPVAVSVPAPNLDLIRRELGDHAARVRLLDMTVVGRNPGRIIPGVLRDFADRFPDQHVRIIGEPIWEGRSETEYPACAQHEALINLAFTGRRVTILCPYDVKRLEPFVLDDAALTHPIIQDSSGERRSPVYAPSLIIDGYNQPLAEPRTAVSLLFDHRNLAEVRHLANEWALAAGLTGTRLDDVQLTVSELGANSLDHGGGAGTLRLWHEEGRLVCEVSDTGHITDPLVGRSPVDPRTAGSRGLLIVNLLSDLVRIHTSEGSTVVRAYFDPPR
ncbi:sensor histidine kinase [Nonomuraea africana]|uniref:Anti-sigma regulatory factor (Ser/Thr protein kinase) n=1 Tax=Nonomuraea africana TaxID=46171 RepID=A0ABR9KM70_9ACTN|nr:sensor histidine kinase [Nonomuraea africana]MBE1562708.1 anti-sigma regulatory factor (Ser/Thr protein kinase) [Nonomuraea africana]